MSKPFIILAAVILVSTPSGRGQETNSAIVRGTNSPTAQTTNSVARSNNATQATSAAASAPATGFDEKSFRIVAERNIFNQSRSSRSSRNTNTEREQERPRPVQVDTFSLVGTMVYEKGPMAFVVGSSSPFQKSLKPGDEIGGYKVESIAPNLLALAKDNKKVEMKVGMQMKRSDGGEWKLSEDAPVYSASSSGGSSSGSKTSGSGGAPSSGSSADEEEIMRRLMEKRAKELEK